MIGSSVKPKTNSFSRRRVFSLAILASTAWTPMAAVANEFPAVVPLSSLDGSNGFRLDGGAVDEHTGWRVSGAGDVNGDGFADVIVTTGLYSTSESTYVVFGKNSGFSASINLQSLNGTNGFRITRPAVGRGNEVAGACDVNGDGFADVIIGVPFANTLAFRSGSSYVAFGKASGFAGTFDLSTLDGSNGFRLDGVGDGSNSGKSVACAGDVNGDGFADVIIGAPGMRSSSGSSYVVFGKGSHFSASIDLSTLDGRNGFRLDGVTAGDGSGFSVASAGDVNSDGFADIIVGALGADNGLKTDSGSSYVVFGKVAGFPARKNLSTLNGTTGFRIDGGVAGDKSGWSVAGAGDVNGDGFADVIIGAPLPARMVHMKDQVMSCSGSPQVSAAPSSSRRLTAPTVSASTAWMPMPMWAYR